MSRWASFIWCQYHYATTSTQQVELQRWELHWFLLWRRDEERFLRNQFRTSRAYVCWSHQVRSFGQTFCEQPMFDTCGCSHVKPSLGNILQCSVEPIEGHCLGWYPLNTSGIPTAGILRCGSFRKSAKTSFLPSQFWQKQASSLSTPTVIVSSHVMFRAVGCWFAGRGRIDFPLRCTTKKTILTITPQDRFWKVNFDPN